MLKVDSDRTTRNGCDLPGARRRDLWAHASGALLAGLAVLLLAACSTARPWVNRPLQPATEPIDVVAVAQRDSSALVAVTLSGGGARAAAFGYGVLEEMRATPCCWNDRGGNLLDAVDLISGVSGGSIVAAYFAAFGSAGLGIFETDFLRQDVQGGLLGQIARPGNLYDLTSPWFGRSQLLERRLETLYRGTTFGDIARRPRHPELVVTATDMSIGNAFDFTAEQFALICSDLSTVPLSFAVTASSAVPVVLSPLTLRNYAADCPLSGSSGTVRRAAADDYRSRMLLAQERSYLEGAARPYIHLVDGGLADNLGVRRLLDRALSSGAMTATFNEVKIAPGSIKRLVLVVVNAGRDPPRHIDASGRVPSTAEVIDTLLFGTVTHATEETTEFLRDVARRWQDDLRNGQHERFPGFAPDAEIFLIPVNLRDAPEAGRRQLLQVPTAFSIDDAEVTRLIDAGRDILRASPEFQRLQRSLQATDRQPP